MTQSLKRIETLTNVAVLVAAALIGVAVIKNNFFGSPARPDAPTQEITGRKLALPDVDWRANRQTLLLILSRSCSFCAQGAPFYRRLVTEIEGRPDVRLIAVLPEDREQGKRYMNELGVPIADVKQASLASLGVKGTPMIILVDESGTASDAWLGKLSPEEESEILASLRVDQACAGRELSH
jgi:hypothetical protein